jgi:hypothetical protein
VGAAVARDCSTSSTNDDCLDPISLSRLQDASKEFLASRVDEVAAHPKSAAGRPLEFLALGEAEFAAYRF